MPILQKKYLTLVLCGVSLVCYIAYASISWPSQEPTDNIAGGEMIQTLSNIGSACGDGDGLQGYTNSGEKVCGPIKGIYSKIDAACGSDAIPSYTAPSTNLCSKGFVTGISGGGPWTWTCYGLNGGQNAACIAYLKQDGACGSSQGKLFGSFPTTNLCTTGTPSNQNTSGNTFSWICSGVNNGIAKNCSATKVVNDFTHLCAGEDSWCYAPVGFKVKMQCGGNIVTTPSSGKVCCNSWSDHGYGCNIDGGGAPFAPDPCYGTSKRCYY